MAKKNKLLSASIQQELDRYKKENEMDDVQMTERNVGDEGSTLLGGHEEKLSGYDKWKIE